MLGVCIGPGPTRELDQTEPAGSRLFTLLIPDFKFFNGKNRSDSWFLGRNRTEPMELA